MRYLSLFSGIGGFEVGIDNAYVALSEAERQQQGRASQDSTVHGESFLGAQCVGYSEIDKYAISVYQKHFPEHVNLGDITKIVAEELPDFDFLVGGFPCQAFSIAGKRKGFDDTRGTLFFEIARILRAKQPRLFLLENVKGLLFHDNGKTFATIIATLTDLGYDLQWQVCNSKDFGVPQNRERVFIVGHLRGTCRPKVFPFTEDSGTNLVLPTLTARYYGAQANGGYIGEVAPALRASDAKRGDNATVVAEPVGPANGQTGPESDHLDLIGRETYSSNIRRLTPLECERLQGFPDGWTEGVSDTQRYKCLGNAVTVNVIQAIVSRII